MLFNFSSQFNTSSHIVPYCYSTVPSQSSLVLSPGWTQKSSAIEFMNMMKVVKLPQTCVYTHTLRLEKKTLKMPQKRSQKCRYSRRRTRTNHSNTKMWYRCGTDVMQTNNPTGKDSRMAIVDPKNYTYKGWSLTTLSQLTSSRLHDTIGFRRVQNSSRSSYVE